MPQLATLVDELERHLHKQVADRRGRRAVLATSPCEFSVFARLRRSCSREQVSTTL